MVNNLPYNFQECYGINENIGDADFWVNDQNIDQPCCVYTLKSPVDDLPNTINCK